MFTNNIYINTNKSDYFLHVSTILCFFLVLHTILIKFVITVLKLQSIKYLIKCFTVNTIYFDRKNNRKSYFSYAVMILLSTVIVHLHGNFADNSSRSSSELQAIYLFCDL